MPSPQIPAHDALWADLIEFLDESDRALRYIDLVDPLAERHGLDDDLVSEMYDSGAGPVFADRISWGLSYLNLAGFIYKPKRGYFTLNDDGKALVGRPLSEVQEVVNEKLKAREEARRAERTASSLTTPDKDSTPSKSRTPSERVLEAYRELRELRLDEILTTVRSMSPAGFERVVVQLLQRLGYGAEIEGAGTVTQYGRDGGIDGIVKEDVLGFGRIYIQAKRYAEGSTVGRPDIQAFLGALTGVGATKGVFITTSHFSRDAQEYATSLATGTALILLDGQTLAAYLYDTGLGMQTKETLELKTLDTDYWGQFGEG